MVLSDSKAFTDMNLLPQIIVFYSNVQEMCSIFLSDSFFILLMEIGSRF